MKKGNMSSDIIGLDFFGIRQFLFARWAFVVLQLENVPGLIIICYVFVVVVVAFVVVVVVVVVVVAVVFVVVVVVVLVVVAFVV
jgi:hypothetical protein